MLSSTTINTSSVCVHLLTTGQRVDGAPRTINTDFNISATVRLPTSTENGTLVTDGGKWGGWSLYLLNGRLTFSYSYFST